MYAFGNKIHLIKEAAFRNLFEAIQVYGVVLTSCLMERPMRISSTQSFILCLEGQHHWECWCWSCSLVFIFTAQQQDGWYQWSFLEPMWATWGQPMLVVQVCFLYCSGASHCPQAICASKVYFCLNHRPHILLGMHHRISSIHMKSVEALWHTLPGNRNQ